MGIEYWWTGPNPFAKYWERRQCKFRAAGWRLEGAASEQVWWRARRKLAKVRVESMRGFEQYGLLVVSFLCPWHFFTSQTGNNFGRHKKDTRTSLQKHCQRYSGPKTLITLTQSKPLVQSISTSIKILVKLHLAFVWQRAKNTKTNFDKSM